MLVDPSPDRDDELLDEALELAVALPIAPLRLVSALSNELDGVPPKPPAIVVVDGGDPPLAGEPNEDGAELVCEGEADPDNKFDAGGGVDPEVVVDPEVGSPETIAEDEPGGFAALPVADSYVNPLPVSEPGWPPPDAAD
jgi:hypothetical protein